MLDISYFTNIVPIQEMRDDDQECSEMLIALSQDADNFIASHRWCPSIKEKFYGFGVGYIVAVFLYHFDLPINGTDDWLWVIVGDIPSAYLVVDAASSPMETLERYCELMEDWANNIMLGNSTENCFPVVAAPTRENAQLLLSRTNFIRKRMICSS